jgi:hypothetical protein
MGNKKLILAVIALVLVIVAIWKRKEIAALFTSQNKQVPVTNDIPTDNATGIVSPSKPPQYVYVQGDVMARNANPFLSTNK